MSYRQGFGITLQVQALALPGMELCLSLPVSALLCYMYYPSHWAVKSD